MAVAEGAEKASFLGRRVGQHRQGLVGMGCQYDMVEGADVAVRRLDGRAVVAANDTARVAKMLAG